MFKKDKFGPKEIKFWAINEGIASLCPAPVPAKKEIPKWYRDASRYIGPEDKLVVGENGSVNSGVKTCMSFLDGITSGYIVKLHCDVMVEQNQNGDGFSMKWSSVVHPLTSRSLAIAEQLPTVPGFGQFLQAWEFKYGFTLPKGYTMLVTQPFNRYDLPTFATTGFVDADTTVGPGGVPFAVADGFEGIIPAGTPILQIIPMKRENWKMNVTDSPYPEMWNSSPRNRLTGWYKNEIWKKKDFS